jgi:hypothetical protein
LVTKGADTRRKVTVGRPIQLALKSGSFDIMALLLRNGVEISECNLSQVSAQTKKFVREGEWREDEWEPDRMADRESETRIEDALNFVYPECPEIDCSKRYTNQEYARGIRERNKLLTA